MDEFLYILFLVGWLVFTVYQQSQKKKRKKAARNLAIARSEEDEDDIQVQDSSAPHKNVPAEEVRPKPEFRTALEEILLGEQVSLETIPREQVQTLAVIPEKKFAERIKVQDYSKKLAESEIREVKEKIVFNEEDTYEESVQHYFNLRNAVIYAEILRPKYVN